MIGCCAGRISRLYYWLLFAVSWANGKLIRFVSYLKSISSAENSTKQLQQQQCETWTVNAFVCTVVVSAALLLLWLSPVNNVVFFFQSLSFALTRSFWAQAQLQLCFVAQLLTASTLPRVDACGGREAYDEQHASITVMLSTSTDQSTVAAAAAAATSTATAKAKAKAKRRNYVYSCRTHFILFIFILFFCAQLFRIFRSSLSTHRRHGLLLHWNLQHIPICGALWLWLPFDVSV